MQSPWLNRAEAAEYLGISVSRLARYSSTGSGGPRFARAPGSSILRYRRDWLDEWLGEPVSSTHAARERDKRLSVEAA